MMTFCKANTAYLLVFVALAFSSCNQKKDVSNEYIPLEVSIGLQKTMCYGSCPSFNFSVLNNGQATLTVGRFAEKAFGRHLDEGEYTGTIELHEISKITEFAENSGYLKLEDRYDNPMVMDIPAAISTINHKTVYNRYEGPDLKDLYSRIEKLISTVDWVEKPDTEK
ncbi:MAG: DUF6438 domain-containing protein [Flavobacteriales bacterium]